MLNKYSKLLIGCCSPLYFIFSSLGFDESLQSSFPHGGDHGDPRSLFFSFITTIHVVFKTLSHADCRNTSYCVEGVGINFWPMGCGEYVHGMSLPYMFA